MSEELQPLVIDLTKSEDLKEYDSFSMNQFAGQVRTLMRDIMGHTRAFSGIEIRGPRSSIKSFLDTVGKEKDYLKTWQKQGFNDPRTWRSRAKLEKAVRQFQRKTGLKWPFK